MKIAIENSSVLELKQRIRFPLIFARVFIYEYWPFWILFSPCVFYWLILSVRSRSLTWFTAVNPGIEHGGVFGESKTEILKNVPNEYLPVTIYINAATQMEEVNEKLKVHQLTFPIICKPDKGEMGYLVEKVNSLSQLERYVKKVGEGFIIQEYVNYPVELGVLYYRMPDKKNGHITSIVSKEFLSVTGDGISTIRELMEQSVRARFQIERLNKQMNLEEVPSNGNKIVLEPIGNHCRGTRFIDSTEIVSDKLNQVFDTIATRMDGFYYGRFDLRVKSIEDLLEGRNIRIMEVNGVTSEPAHIYDTKMNLFSTYASVFQHMQIIFKIARANHANGVSYIGAISLLRKVMEHFKNKSKV